MEEEPVFPIKIGEKNIDYHIEITPYEGGAVEDIRIKICSYLDDDLFDIIRYRVRKMMRPVVPLSQRTPVYTLYDSNRMTDPFYPYKSIEADHLTEEEMKDVVWNIQQDIKEQIEREAIMLQAKYNSGTCIICEEPQTNTSMKIGNHICSGCVIYVVRIYDWLKSGILTTHKLVDEGRYIYDSDKNKWIMNIRDNETSPYWLHKMFEGVKTD